jgi:hypothetical protein
VAATFHLAEYIAMKMLVTAGAIAIASSVAVMHAIGADAPNRPPGVNASDWAPISDTMGFVLVEKVPRAPELDPGIHPRGPEAGQSAVVPPAVGGHLMIGGYLMIRRGDAWQRLIVIEPSRTR